MNAEYMNVLRMHFDFSFIIRLISHMLLFLYTIYICNYVERKVGISLIWETQLEEFCCLKGFLTERIGLSHKSMQHHTMTRGYWQQSNTKIWQQNYLYFYFFAKSLPMAMKAFRWFGILSYRMSLKVFQFLGCLRCCQIKQ